MKIRCWMFSKPCSAGWGDPLEDPDDGDAAPEDPLEMTTVDEPPPVHAAAATANREAISRMDRRREVTARDPIRPPEIGGDVRPDGRE
jgi:hypothetical protein